jgi:hypothetical protein
LAQNNGDIPEKNPSHCLLSTLVSHEVVTFLEVVISSQVSHKTLIPNLPPPTLYIIRQGLGFRWSVHVDVDVVLLHDFVEVFNSCVFNL